MYLSYTDLVNRILTMQQLRQSTKCIHYFIVSIVNLKSNSIDLKGHLKNITSIFSEFFVFFVLI